MHITLKTLLNIIGNKAKGWIWRFGVLCFLVTSVLRFSLLPYYRRYVGWKTIAFSCTILRKTLWCTLDDKERDLVSEFFIIYKWVFQSSAHIAYTRLVNLTKLPLLVSSTKNWQFSGIVASISIFKAEFCPRVYHRQHK